MAYMASSYSNFQKKRLNRFESMFNELDTSTRLRGYFTKMDTIKDTKRWWEISYLEQYLKEGLIPRGLREEKTPASGLNDEKFMDRWYAILQKCPFELMQLIIEREKEVQKDIEKEIQELESVLPEIEKEVSFEEQEKDMYQNIEKLDNKIAET